MFLWNSEKSKLEWYFILLLKKRKKNEQRINKNFICPENWSKNDHDFYGSVEIYIYMYIQRNPCLSYGRMRTKEEIATMRAILWILLKCVIENKFTFSRFGSLGQVENKNAKKQHRFILFLAHFTRSWEFEYGYKLVLLPFTETAAVAAERKKGNKNLE